MRIIPSIASARFLQIHKLLKELDFGGSLHIDIEDGNFVPNITFGLKLVQEIHEASGLPLNVHLMVTDPFRYIEPLAVCGVKEIAFHLESAPYPLAVLHEIRKRGMKAGLAFNLATPVKMGEAFLEETDFLLIMTAEEDGNDQAFRTRSLDRIAQARGLAGKGKHIWADGGIGERELALVRDAGADTAVMGRALVREKNPCEKLSCFLKRFG